MPFPAIGAAVVVKGLVAGGIFAKGAVDATVLTAGIGAIGATVTGFLSRQAAAQAARTALGVAIAPWVGGVLLAGTILYGGYKLLNSQADKGLGVDASINLKNMEVHLKNKKLNKSEFEDITKDEKFTAGLKKAVKEYQDETKCTAEHVYKKIMGEFESMGNFDAISKEAKSRYASVISGYNI